MKLLIALLALAALVAGGGSEVLYHNRIMPRVRVHTADVSAGGQTQNALMARLAPFSLKQRFRVIALRAPRGAAVYVPAYRLGYSVDGGLTAWRAYHVGRDGSLVQRLQTQITALLRGVSVPVAQRVNQRALHAYLVALAPSLSRRARRGVPGRVLDVARAQQRISRRLMGVGAFSLDLPFTTVVARPARHALHRSRTHIMSKQRVAA